MIRDAADEALMIVFSLYAVMVVVSVFLFAKSGTAKPALYVLIVGIVIVGIVEIGERKGYFSGES